MISKYIVRKAIQYEVVEESERELYEVSFSTMLFCGLNWGTLLIFGAFQRCLLGCLLFMTLYIPLRIFSGGLHLSTRFRCYCFSLLVFFIMLKIYKHLLFKSTIYNMLLFLSIPVIALLSPKDDKKKPLAIRERKRNKRIVLLILLIETVLIIIFRFFNSDASFYFSSFVFVLMLVQLLLGEIRNIALNSFVL